MRSQKRPRRRTREHLQHLLRCPLCWGDGTGQEQGANPDEEGTKQPTPLKTVAYRNLGARLECPQCGLRFTVPIVGTGGLAHALKQPKIELRCELSVWDVVADDSIDLDDPDVELRVIVANSLESEHQQAVQRGRS
jgi:transcription elongation factor Elf1